MPVTQTFKTAWEQAGYDEGAGSMHAAPAPKPGFKRLYYLTGPDFAVSNIVFGRVKISRFAELNDPFELLGTNFGHKPTKAAVREYKEQVDKKFGLICLSEDWTDPVLWSHYGAKHRGVALGFDVDCKIVKQVRYESNRLGKKILPGVTEVTDSIADLLTYTKFESWRYEREWRMLRHLSKAEAEGGLYFQKINRRMKLVEVILGPLCVFGVKRLRTLVDEHLEGVTTFQARLADRTFRVIARGASVPLPV